jgi:4-amino-4-deoxychorismate lyase
MSIPIIDDHQIIDSLSAQKNPFFKDYYAFYSSWYGGITTNPVLMLLPIDDHIVHRGDGIFEAFKVMNGAVYLFEEHLQRLNRSAEKVALKLPVPLEKIREIVLQTLQIANKNEATVRLYVSRGPGNFTVNPYDSVQAQLYVVVTKLTYPTAQAYIQGIHIGQSRVPAKQGLMAQAKTCNYLPNVLMKKEAVDRNLEFVIGVDPQGNITESATENIMIVDSQGIIVHPPLDNILRGTTMIRACELARENGMATEVRAIKTQEMPSAREAMIVGTTLDVLPAVKFENHIIGSGKPGPIAQKLQQLLLDDIKSGHKSIAF